MPRSASSIEPPGGLPEPTKRGGAALSCAPALAEARVAQIFDDALHLASGSCRAPMALLSIVGGGRYRVRASVGFAPAQVPADDPFAGLALDEPDLFVVTDLAVDSRFAARPSVTTGPRCRFYAGVVLHDPEGACLGCLGVLDIKPRQLTGKQKESLRIVGRQVEERIAHEQSAATFRQTAEDLREAQETLRKSDERFRGFMDNSPAVAYIKDEEGRFVYVSEPCARRFQKPAAEWLGKTDYEIVGKTSAEHVMEHDLTVLNTEGTVVVEELVPTPDGRTLCWLSYKFLLHDDAGRKQVGGLSFDITERKDAEQERERLLGELREALAEVKTLSGFLPICASCKNIRDDAGYWRQIESYLSQHSDVEFTHGICPNCIEKLYPDFVARKRAAAAGSADEG